MLRPNFFPSLYFFNSSDHNRIFFFDIGSPEPPPLPLPSPLSLRASRGSGAAGWPCAACTFHNAANADTCAICQSHRSGRPVERIRTFLVIYNIMKHCFMLRKLTLHEILLPDQFSWPTLTKLPPAPHPELHSLLSRIISHLDRTPHFFFKLPRKLILFTIS